MTPYYSFGLSVPNLILIMKISLWCQLWTLLVALNIIVCYEFRVSQ